MSVNFKRKFVATLVTETMEKNKPEIAQLLIRADNFKNYAINSKGKVNSQIQGIVGGFALCRSDDCGALKHRHGFINSAEYYHNGGKTP